MTSVCIYFKLHRPYRLKNYPAKHIGLCHCYEDTIADKESIDHLADDCCLPVNTILYKHLMQQKGRLKVSFSISGVVLELLEKYRPDVIDSFQQLAETGWVEFLAETYYHSLSSLYSGAEFQRQVLKHMSLIIRLFGKQSSVFRNTGLIHNNRIALLLSQIGLKGIVCEAAASLLRGRDCNQLYKSPGNENLALLIHNATILDDSTVTYDHPNCSVEPLICVDFVDWLHQHPDSAELVNVFVDYETSVINKKSSNFFKFLESLPTAVSSHDNLIFSTPSDIIASKTAKDIYDSPQTISCYNKMEEPFAWCRNVMQNNTLKKIYSLEKLVMQSPDQADMDTWGRLQSADYFYYMAGRQGASGKYINPFSTGEEAYQYYTNLVADFEISVIKKMIAEQKKSSKLNNIPFNILTN